MNQRGLGLVELLVAMAVLAVMAGAAFVLSVRLAAFQSHAGAAEFDAALAYARTLAASSGNGATVALRPSGPGFTATVYAGRPDGAGIVPAPVSPFESSAAISEQHLGGPPLTVFLDGAGHVSAASGDLTTAALARDPGCPAGAADLRFRLSPGTLRVLPCRVRAAGAP